MNRIILVASLLTLALAACDRQAARLDQAAEKCAEAVNVGALEVAEELCAQALGENNGANLRAETRSGRLYRLGTIKRALAKYPEARELMLQSLAIEEAGGEDGIPELGERLLELSLIMAGLNQWEEGVPYLDRLLPVAGQLDEQEQKSLSRIIVHYAGRLEQRQADTAARFRKAQVALQERLQAPAKPASP